MYRPSTGMWYVRNQFEVHWGLPGDLPVPGDYDGDGRTDVAVYRPSSAHWFILESTTNYTQFVTYQWGFTGDVPVAGDYDGDGRTDIAVFRPSTGTWYIRYSATGAGATLVWGGGSDIPIGIGMNDE